MGYDINQRSFSIVSQPALEPVTAQMFKDYARLDDDIDDNYLLLYTKAARKQAEHFTGMKFITQSVKTRIDYFPEGDYQKAFLDDAESFGGGWQTGARRFYWPSDDYIDLAFRPIQSITSLTTYDTSNAATVLASSNYFLDAQGERLVLNIGAIWPVNLRQRAAVEVVTVNGFGIDSSFVPEDIQLAILAMAQRAYSCRGGSCDTSQDPPCLGMLDTYKNYSRKGL